MSIPIEEFKLFTSKEVKKQSPEVEVETTLLEIKKPHLSTYYQQHKIQ